MRKVEERFVGHLREYHSEVATGLPVEQHDQLEQRVRHSMRHE